MTRAALAVLGMLVLAGCAGSPPASVLTSDHGGATQGTAPSGVDDPPQAILSFPAAGPAEAEESWEGAFGPADTCNPAGCLRGTWLHPYEITHLLPERVLVHVQAELTYQNPAGVFAAPMDLYGRWDDLQVYDLRVDAEQAGVLRVESFMFRSSGSAFVDVAAYWPSDAAPSTAYTLAISASYDPTFVPPGVPVLVPTANTDTLGVRAIDGAAVDVVVYDLDGNLLERRTGSGEAEVSRGGHDAVVLVAAPESSVLRVRGGADAAPLEALRLRYELGAAREATPNEAVTWSFDTAKVPLAVGVYGTPSQEYWAQYGEATATVKGPGGVVLDAGFTCNLCLSTNAPSFALVSALAAPGLDAGSYEATVTVPASAFQNVGEVLVYFGT